MATRKRAAKGLHSTRFPGEKPAYRAARDKLLKKEIELRRQVEAVAALRRALPLGGELKEDYAFDELRPSVDQTTARGQVKLSELFAAGKDTLLAYSYMFGPKMGAPCPMCTSMLDSLDGQAPHISQLVNLAVVAKSPIDRIRAFTTARGWRNLRLLSSAGNAYNHDYHGETDEGAQIPTMNVFTRRKGRIYHTWSSETMFVPPDRGQDARHVDMIWPLWNVLDLTPNGRGKKWNPKLRYD